MMKSTYDSMCVHMEREKIFWETLKEFFYGIKLLGRAQKRGKIPEIAAPLSRAWCKFHLISMREEFPSFVDSPTEAELSSRCLLILWWSPSLFKRPFSASLRFHLCVQFFSTVVLTWYVLPPKECDLIMAGMGLWESSPSITINSIANSHVSFTFHRKCFIYKLQWRLVQWEKCLWLKFESSLWALTV